MDDHNIYVGNLRICNKIQRIDEKVGKLRCMLRAIPVKSCLLTLYLMRCGRILSVLACPVRAPKTAVPCGIQQSGYPLWHRAEDEWELPDSGNVIRHHVSTGKYLGASLIPLDSTIRLTDQVSCMYECIYACMNVCMTLLTWGYGIFMIVLESWKMYETPTYTPCNAHCIA